MAETIQIGSTSSDPRVLSKQINLTISANVNLKMPCSMVAPTFLLDYQSAFTSCNYLYFPSWGRYYYIKDIVMLDGGRCEFQCAVDPLMSFQNEIKGLNVLVKRQQQKRSSLQVDGEYPICCSYVPDYYVFPNNVITGYGASNPYVLSLVGGSE